MKIALAQSDAQIAACFDVMRQLRPHLKSDEFVALIRSMMDSDGFHLGYLEDGGVRAVAGFRFLHMLHAGKVLYVDDLVTSEDARSKGHGKALFHWLLEQAKEAHCAKLTLDSGTQRIHAHRFYLRERMVISSFHFVMDVPT